MGCTGAVIRPSRLKTFAEKNPENIFSTTRALDIFGYFGTLAATIPDGGEICDPDPLHPPLQLLRPRTQPPVGLLQLLGLLCGLALRRPLAPLAALGALGVAATALLVSAADAKELLRANLDRNVFPTFEL